MKKYDDYPDEYKYLFFKNGKARKSFCKCTSKEKRKEFKKLYGREIIQCAGLQCPFYPIGCGISIIEEFEKMRNKGNETL